MKETKIYQSLIEYLKDFISKERYERISEVLDNRTNHLTVVLEDLHKSHNANAVLRSCDGFGIQDVHIIENRNKFDEHSSVSIGAHSWLTLNRYNEDVFNNIDICFEALRANDYQIIATTPHEKDLNIRELDVTKKTALVFGTELEGVSDEVIRKSDGFVKIPMFGFSESFNISVSAAISMYELTTRMRNDYDFWQLDNDYKIKLKFNWIKQSIKAGDKLVEKFLEDHQL
jgi:tRNA (guanosine-2'-O-)-methyltransferase